MRLQLYILLIFSLVITSCNSNNEEDIESFEDLDCPPFYNYNIDVDEDGIFDFSVFCSKSILTPFGNAYGHMFISLEPSENNYYLSKTYTGLFFLEPGDIINTELTTSSGLFWINGVRPMLLKGYYTDRGWDDTWSPNSDITSYYLGFKLGNGDVEKLGWIQFQFDVQTGEFFITDKNYTSSNSIIIGQ